MIARAKKKEAAAKSKAVSSVGGGPAEALTEAEPPSPNHFEKLLLDPTSAHFQEHLKHSVDPSTERPIYVEKASGGGRRTLTKTGTELASGIEATRTAIDGSRES